MGGAGAPRREREEALRLQLLARYPRCPGQGRRRLLLSLPLPLPTRLGRGSLPRTFTFCGGRDRGVSQRGRVRHLLRVLAAGARVLRIDCSYWWGSLLLSQRLRLYG